MSNVVEKEDDKKDLVIIVNAEEKVWTDKSISFEQLAEIAYGSYEDNEAITYSITYKRGMGNKPEGSLIKGQSVQVKDKMIFNVTRTNRS
ncbi:multiubiquitin domain-containing protein [Lacibacter sediminis]|uniref:Multiubiquitin domain-containing protein n=1 Tax=Lacibacter sediminis TaxID=2760713 RepID=A0A7G5XK52_9BACT|nr:multiubiquitin domain-containing protein [Lacibacter sediminis]QNA45855.1 multiubiquitin domain-containing protein [Lacibacter sediminis]